MWLMYLLSGITLLLFLMICFGVIIVCISKVNDLDDSINDIGDRNE